MTTRHSIQRARERLGLHEKRAQRVIELAYARGKRIEDFRGGDCKERIRNVRRFFRDQEAAAY